MPTKPPEIKGPDYKQLSTGIPKKRGLGNFRKRRMYNRFIKRLFTEEDQEALRKLGFHLPEGGKELAGLGGRELKAELNRKGISLQDIRRLRESIDLAHKHVKEVISDERGNPIDKRGHIGHHFNNFIMGPMGYLQLVEDRYPKD